MVMQTGAAAHERFTREAPTRGEARLAQGLGLFSVGIGLAELLFPRQLANAIGVKERPLLLRVLGLRELASGVGVLAQDRPAAALWSRVAGDALDLALLGVAMGSDESDRVRVATAAAAVSGVTALDVLGAARHTRRASGPRRVTRALAINRSPEECYAKWRDLEGLPLFMEQLESVQVLDEKRSRWVACGPAGRSVEWVAEIARDQPNEAIAWRSVEGEVETEGEVRFEARPGKRGCLVRVTLDYRPPAGALGRAVAKLFLSAPEQQLKEDLRRFKRVIETGEIPTTEGQPSGPREAVHRTLAKAVTGGVS